MDSFGARLRHAMDARGPLCVGIDPHPALMRQWALDDDVAGLARFAGTVVEAIGDTVAVAKPQSAFFERFGSHGIAVLESTIRQLREAGVLVLLDAKRGDIGSTAAAYAAAYLDQDSPIAVDAITANPFLGFGSLSPMIDTAHANGAGVFVVTLTSNPEGEAVQRARGIDGRTVAQAIIDEIAQVNRGRTPMGSIGAVIGATLGATGHTLTHINGPMLAPGLGAQGATADDLRAVFGDDLGLVLPSYSREILRHGPSVPGLRAAVDRARNECFSVIAASDGAVGG